MLAILLSHRLESVHPVAIPTWSRSEDDDGSVAAKRRRTRTMRLPERAERRRSQARYIAYRSTEHSRRPSTGTIALACVKPSLASDAGSGLRDWSEQRGPTAWVI